MKSNDSGSNSEDKIRQLKGTDYVNTRDAAYNDAVEAYKDLDKWLLALTGGGTAILATQLSDSENFSMLHIAGMLFASSVFFTLFSKWGSYKNSLETINTIEKVWNESDDNFPTLYHDAADSKIVNDNKSTHWKDRCAFGTFIVGIALVAFSFVPTESSSPSLNRSTEQNAITSNGTAAQNTGTPTSKEGESRTESVAGKEASQSETSPSQKGLTNN